jgi:hypothetical protein
MSQKSGSVKEPAEKFVQNIRRGCVAPCAHSGLSGKIASARAYRLIRNRLDI